MNKKIIDNLWIASAKESSKVVDSLKAKSKNNFLFTPENKINRSEIKREVGIDQLIEYWDRVKANPSISIRSRLIKGYFCFADSEQVEKIENSYKTKGMKSRCINQSEMHLTNFIDECIKRAKLRPLQYSLDGSSTLRSDVPKFITALGSKGTGKTFLQNYIVSEYAEKFNSEKVIWIRINLARDFNMSSHIDGNKNLASFDLDKWIKAQIAKILCRYYDVESRVIKKENILKNTKRLYSFREAAMKELTTDGQKDRALFMLNTFYRVIQDKDLNISWLESTAIEKIVEYAASLGINFIIALDGLDLLDHTERMKKDFEHVHLEVARYLTEEFDRGMFFLVFMREESLEAFYDSMPKEKIAAYDDYILDTLHNFVSPPELDAIYKNRVKTLTSSEVATELNIKSELIKEFNDYVNNVEEHENNSILNLMLNLKNKFGPNTRAAVQLLHAALCSFTAKPALGHVQQPKYHLTELMMLGRDTKFPIKPPSYTYVSTEGFDGIEPFTLKKKAVVGNNEIYSTHFLPSIYRYPVDIDVTHTEKSAIYNVLAGLRILQSIEAFCSTNAFKNGVPIVQILSYVNKVFDYPNYLLESICEELLLFEILEITKNKKFTMPILTRSVEKSVDLTPKGNQILNHYFADLTYLFLSCYSVPWPESVLVKSNNFMREFVPPPSVNSNYLAAWVSAKINNGMNLANIISILDRLQLLESRKPSTLTKDQEIVYDLMFFKENESSMPKISVSANIESRVKEASSHVLTSISNHELFPKILSNLKN